MLTNLSKLILCQQCCEDMEQPAAMHVAYYPHNRPWTWKPLHPADRQKNTVKVKQPEMAEMKRSETILRILAQELLTEQECHIFKQALHHFRVSHSVTSLCQQLKPVINAAPKFLLLVELSSRLPKSLQEDFHRLCALQYTNYETYLRLLSNGNSPNGIPKVIAQDSAGRFKIMSSRNSEKKMTMRYNNQKHTYELHSLPGTSVTSGVYSDTGDDQSDDDDDDKVDISDVPANNGRVTPVHLKGKRNVHRVFLHRHDDGSLGLGISGGLEFGTEIVISVVEEGGPAATQGLNVGDKILEVNGHLFEDIMHAEAVTIMRNAWNLIMLVQSPEEDIFSFDVDPVQQPVHRVQAVELIVYPTSTGKLGCSTQRLHNQDLMVTTVADNSPAQKGGLLIDDQVVKIDNVCVREVSEKQILMLTKSKRLNICVKRNILDHIDEADLINQRQHLLTSQQSRRPFAGFPPEKLRRVHRHSESELQSNSGRDHSAESKPSGHNKENSKPPSPKSPRRIYANRPEHYKHHKDINWVLSPKSRENRYIRRRDMYAREPVEQNYQAFSRSRSADPYEIKNMHNVKDSGIQNTGPTRYVRNRSYSPHRSAIAIRQIHQEDNVIRAIQQGLEKRQRAVRLSMHQMADPADYEWEI